MFSGKYCGNFKINCFEEHLPTAVSIRRYFDTINLKQFGFYTTNSFEILVSERKFKNHFKNRESKTNIRQFSYTAYNADVMFYHKIPWFYQYFKSENLLLSLFSNLKWGTKHLYNSKGFYVTAGTIFLFFRSQIYECS